MISNLSLLFDFGLLVLTLLVQLIIYPSFKSIGEEIFIKWHSNYTTSMTIIVFPLMMGQLFFKSYTLYENFSNYSILGFSLILLIWGITFIAAIPLHNSLQKGGKDVSLIDKLITINRYRTLIWSIVFLLSIGNLFNVL